MPPGLSKNLLITFVLLFVVTTISAQEDSFTRSSFLTTSYNQVNEAQNFGLVFKGPGLNYGMEWHSAAAKRYISYGYAVGIGILFAKEIPAPGFYFKPVDLEYFFRIRGVIGNLYMGPMLKLEYNYNLYPDLQAGFDYWFTNMSAGIGAMYDFNHKNSYFRIKINSSVAGLISRQEAYRNPYYYDLGVKHAVKHLHRDLYAGSFEKFNVSGLEISYKIRADSRLTMGYFLDYYGFFNEPGLTILNHGIKLIISKKQVK